MTLDATDRQIIEALQAGLPLVPAPYAAVAEQLNLPEDALTERLAAMKASGVIRRIAAAPNHYKLGMTANGMTVWDVADDQITELGALIGALPFVTHCYERPRALPEWPYNLFAMVHGSSREEVEEKRARIKDILGDALRASDVLVSTRILKKTGLRLRKRG
ncbi:AsnC family transcriptional regulator [uncultured Shimia sp.]|uniref:siroheme decarboxylase subunit beta n=1 Tax=uncultured Shimia sp. TaxID=573152 RepID=UPI0026189DEE|nr:AsnC family transcriptional regulator [uncultured Shimia sp.]